MKIKDIADIHTGYPFRSKIEHDPKGDFRVIQISDVKDGRTLNPDDLISLDTDRDPRDYFVSKDDVLFLTRGQKLFATAITEPLDHTIVVSYFVIVRPDTDRVDPRFLAWTMNQEPFQEALSPFIRGSHMPMVSRKDVAQMPITLPPLETQQTIVELDQLHQREQSLLQQIQHRRHELITALCLSAANNAAAERTLNHG